MYVTIIGGGASGIACAIKIKQNNRSANVVVLEHLDEACKKIYATGNGRCNMTNKAADGYEITKAFFDSLGLIMRSDSAGRMYPNSNQASTVVDILISACKKYGVTIKTSCNIRKVEKIGNIYNVYSNKGTFSSDVLVLATGGMSQPALGSDGSGYELAREFGHSVTPLSPALVQLKSSSKHCRALKGIRAKCNVKIEINGTIVGSEFGELLFADYGISGIVVMELSKYVIDERIKNGSDKCIAVIDFVPDMSEDKLYEHFITFGGLEGVLPKKLCSILSRQTDNDGRLIAKYAKSWRLIITGTKGYDFAQITNGGVSRDELKSTNESTINDNLYIIGELTDNQFECGGFNLDYAFSSGIAAADDITSKTYDKN
ncbi:MAG: NAD(P)/FAD-dependent oxidoreductase [Eubacterium sp.]